MTNETKRQDGPAEYLTLSQAAQTLPHRPHASTLHRWRTRGIRGVRLQTCLLGGRRFTTKVWLDDFLELSSKAGDPDASPANMPPRGRDAGFNSVKAKLDAAGF